MPEENERSSRIRARFDIVTNSGRVMDPETMYDTVCNVGIKDGRIAGIPYVVVNGTIVVQDSKVLKGANPGQPIRFEPEAKGRFEPLSLEAWKHIYTVSPVEFGGTEPFGEHGLDCC